ncbi:MAG TPA: L-rhamnose isomerase [Capsulimonadaceae bacterium]|jgi:L-rhamnose isomerase/sugar isomerase
MARQWDEEYRLLAARLSDSGISVDAVIARLKKQHIETPSWAYADAGTRFGTFQMAGAPRSVEEKFEDAAQVHKFTGVAPSVAVHIPWDVVPDWSKMAAYAKELGVSIGSVNPNVFQDRIYQYGSLGNTNAAARSQAVEHMKECVGIMRAANSKFLSLWFADGTNFPGQGDMRQRKQFFIEGLSEVYKELASDETMLIEYKPFEPAFYHTDIADWGMAFALAQRVGDRAKVLVDLGHHLPGSNIEHIVAFLLDEGRLGGFHFNNRKYADDDLTVGSVQPYELFLIYSELVAGENAGIANNVAYMIDQSHTLKNKIEEMIQSVVNLQSSYAKALIVDRAALAAAQAKNDVIVAEEAIKAAYDTDVSPLLWRARTELGIPGAENPLLAFRASGYGDQKAAERGFGGSKGVG